VGKSDDVEIIDYHLGEKSMIENGMRPIHPGEILREDYLIPLGLSVNALAKALRVPATRLHEIVKERRGITPDTALRLARYFGSDAQSWMNLQIAYDLSVAKLQTLFAIEREVLPREASHAASSLDVR
jgi:addiction module HigA family antidote